MGSKREEGIISRGRIRGVGEIKSSTTGQVFFGFLTRGICFAMSSNISSIGNDGSNAKPSNTPSLVSDNDSPYSSQPATLVDSEIGNKSGFLKAPPQSAIVVTSADGSPEGSVTGDPQKRMDAILDMDPAAAEPVSGLEVVKVDKPHSKTAIGRVSQKVKTLPLIHTVEFELTIGGELVKGRKLRRDAAELWLKEHKAESFQQLAVEAGGQLGVVRVLLHIKDEQERQSVQRKLDGLDNTQSITMPKKGSGEEKVIHFKIKVPEVPAGDTHKTSLRPLLREMRGQLELLPLTTSSSHIFDPLLPGCFRSSSSSQPSDYVLYLRNQLSADFTRKEIITEFDAIPCAPGKPLYEVVLDMVGQIKQDPSHVEVIQDWLPKIRQSLLGMHVRCLYTPGKRAQEAKILTQTNVGQGRCFQIRDIQTSDAANDKFDIGKLSYRTYGYFKDSKFSVFSLSGSES
jgi:hypothetical protein